MVHGNAVVVVVGDVGVSDSGDMVVVGVHDVGVVCDC